MYNDIKTKRILLDSIPIELSGSSIDILGEQAFIKENSAVITGNYLF